MKSSSHERSVSRLLVALLAAVAALQAPGLEAQFPGVLPFTTTITYPAVAVAPGQDFVFRLTCLGTFRGSPCQATVLFLGLKGEVIQEFEPVFIEEGQSKEFLLLVGFDSRTAIRVFAEVVAVRPADKPLPAKDCCCKCDETPSVVEIVDEQTGKTEVLTSASACIRAAGGKRK